MVFTQHGTYGTERIGVTLPVVSYSCVEGVLRFLDEVSW